VTNTKGYKVQAELSGKGGSSLRRYQDLVLGSRRWRDLVLYELVQLVASWVPGALGLLLRKKLYPLLLGACGRGVVFGRDVTLRHPRKIQIGEGSIIDDGVLLDAKGGEDSGIVLGRESFVGRGSVLSCKGGRIELGDRTNLGFHSEIFSSNRVTFGKDVLVAAYSYILGGGNYGTDPARPINLQYDPQGKGGVTVGDDVWIGTHAVVTDGARIGSGAVIGAGSVVTRAIPPYGIAVGTPARVVRSRQEEAAASSGADA
jgi:acetyltransferase-like isoleucine patch superfamily enzyme